MSKSKITEETVDIGPIFKRGDILQSKLDKDIIIMITYIDTFSAVVLTNRNAHEIGIHGPAWNFDEFELFKGKITLYND